MSTITLVYGIKFTLRAEEAERQESLALEFGGNGSLANVTYFNNTVNGSNNAELMMQIELPAWDALERGLLTEEQLGQTLNVTAEELPSRVNDTVQVVRPVAEKVPYPSAARCSTS